MAPFEQYILPVSCPRCGAPPRLFTGDLRKVQISGAPEEVVQTYQCAFKQPDGRLCNQIYEIRVKDFQRARVRSS